MGKQIFVFMLSFFLFACSEEGQPKEKKPESLVEIVDGVYTEYYPGRKVIKFQGSLDKENKRDGKWTFFSTNGNDLSVTHYNHGLKDGHTIVKHPNGALFYYGEYENDKKIGVWKTYDTKGKLLREENFDSL